MRKKEEKLVYCKNCKCILLYSKILLKKYEKLCKICYEAIKNK